MSVGIQFYFVMVTQFVTKIFAFVASVLVARVMGPTVVGIIAFAYAFVGLFEFLFDMGTGTAHIKRISEGRDYSKCLGAYALLKALLSFLALGVVLAAYTFIYQYREGFQDQVQRTVIFIILGSVVVDQVFMFYFNTFKAQLKFGKSQIIKSVKDIADALLVIAVVIFWRNIYVLAAVYLVSESIGAVMGFVLLKNKRIRKPDASLLKSYVKFSIPMFAITVGWTVYQNIDKVMIRSFWPAADVGIYHVGYRICAFALLLGTSLNAILFPTVSKLHGEGKLDSIREVLYKGERFTALLITPFALVCAVFAQPIILNIWGEAYLPVIPILRVLAIFTVFACMGYPLSAGIMGIGRIWAYFWLFAINLLLLISSNLIFIPESVFGIKTLGLGALGAAWGTLVAIFFGYILRKFLLHRYIRIDLSCRVFTAPLVGCLIGGAFWLVNRLEISLMESLYLLPIALAAYFTLAFLFRAMTGEDIRLIIRILKPSSTKKYLTDEFQRSAD
ncbi:MAG: flippase [Candidatus Erginobacter occultus]|nr:flippase [Candidatus Erginobacter occultus]